MKIRSCLSLILLLALLLLCGCSAVFTRADSPQEIELQPSAQDSAEVDPSCRSQGAVVSIVSIGTFRYGLALGSVVSITSGVIIDHEGYVVSSSEAALPTLIDQNGDIYVGEATAIYAVLSDVYQNDRSLYKLDLVDMDEDRGLALLSFYDRFYYDAEDFGSGDRVGRTEGFPIVAEFSAETALTGMPCTIIGNAISGVMNDLQYPFSMEYVCLSASRGIVASASAADFLISAAISAEMGGSAIFDASGYLIGLVSQKLPGDTAGDSTYLENITSGICSAAIIDYIDTVSASLHVPIPYTVATGEAAA